MTATEQYKSDAEKLLRYIVLNNDLFNAICSPGGKIEISAAGFNKFNVKVTTGVFNEETGEVTQVEESHILSTEKESL